MLLEMRNYRLGLVQTPNQLRFAYEAIINAKNSGLFERETEPEDSKESKEPTTSVVSEQKSNEKELRRRVREEKNRNTMEQIKRIKEKQKEIENWSKQKVRIKYIALVIGVSALSAGLVRSYLW